MMPLPGRPLSATLIRSGSETILFDCGENTQVNWRESGFAFRSTGSILLSHLHADHVAGLPGVLFQLAHAGRSDPVTIYGPERTHEIVSHLVVIVGRLPYELRVVELTGGESLELVAGFTLSALSLAHRMPCLGYRLDLPRAPRFDPERARALGVPVEGWSRLQRGETVGASAPIRCSARHGAGCVSRSSLTPASSTPCPPSLPAATCSSAKRCTPTMTTPTAPASAATSPPVRRPGSPPTPASATSG
jgi:ribonuclease BN (tRNA processing enzyme)